MPFSKPVVIIDNGSYNIKAGFSCDNHPVSIFRTVVGRPNYLNGHYGKQDYEVYIGDDAMAKIEDYELCSPVVNGRIVHWDNMERVWHHIFYRELKCAPEDRAVLLTCAARTPIKEKYDNLPDMVIKIECCEVFLETLNAPALCIQPQGVLAVYGSGYTTGLSVDLGYDTTDISPCYEGGLIKYAHMQTNLASRQVSQYIESKLTEKKVDLGHQVNEVIEGIKREMYVFKEFALSAKFNSKEYTLPGGQKIEVGEEEFIASEMIFQPKLVCGDDCKHMPLQVGVTTAALKCDPELTETMYEAIIPWGGLATLPGLVERLKVEVEDLIQRPANVLPNLEPYTVAWLGGSTFAGIKEAQKVWITKKQFEDHGEKIVSNKFL